MEVRCRLKTQRIYDSRLARLVIDIAGYSKRLIDDQRELQQQLNQIVRNSSQFRAAEAAKKLVRLPTGDGMALVFLTTVDAPVQCAVEISEALSANSQLKGNRPLMAMTNAMRKVGKESARGRS